MNPESAISHTVMRRVRTIHLVRAYAPIIAAFAVFVFALWGIGREVWVAKVFENLSALTDVPSVLSFFAGAFIGTELMVQVLSVLVVVALAWLTSEVVHRLEPRGRFA